MISTFYNKLIYFLEKFLNRKYWYFPVSIITALTILLLTAPSYYPLTKDFKPCSTCVSFQEVINRADHLLTPAKYQVGAHLANTPLRLTVPLIAKLIGSRSKVVMFIIQEIFGVSFLIITCLLSYKITKDKIIAAIITLSIGFIYAGKSAFVDIEGFTDSFAYFFLILALFTDNKPIILISLTLAYLTDERALLASSLVAIFYFLEFLEMNDGKFNISSILKSRVFYIVLSWALHFLIRFILFKVYGIFTPSSGVNMPDIQRLGEIFWDGLQGFWLLVALGILYLIIEKRYFIILLLTISFLVIAIAASMVDDLTRSTAYDFPIIFVSLYLVTKAMNNFQIRKIVILGCVISFLCADSFYVTIGKPRYYQSIPMKTMEKVLSHGK